MTYKDEGSDEQPMRSSRTPLKQLMDELRGHKNPFSKILVEDYDRHLARAKARQAEARAAAKREARADAEARLEQRIEKQYSKRLKRLRLAVKHMRVDKRIQQLVGREIELATFWKAMQLANLWLGANATDQHVADIFAGQPGGKPNCTKHQARTRRKLVTELEAMDHVWKKV